MFRTMTLIQVREQVQNGICELIVRETDEKDCNIRKCVDALYDARKALDKEIEKGETDV